MPSTASTTRDLPPVRALAALAVLWITVSAVACGRADAGSRTGSDDLAGRVLEEPVPMPDVVLTDVSDGRPFDLREETEGSVTLLFVGYTHCPDVCPVHMANIAAVLPELSREVSRRIEVVFISSDPERDTPERIREWLAGFDPSFIGLRGSRAEVRRIEEQLGLPPSVVGSGEVAEGESAGAVAGSSDTEPRGGDYFVGHAAQVLAFGADDVARVAYPWGTRQRDWRHDLPRLARGEIPLEAREVSR